MFSRVFLIVCYDLAKKLHLIKNYLHLYVYIIKYYPVNILLWSLIMIKKYFLVFLISMIPLIELRGSVPIGLSNLWGGPIDILPLYLICIIGNMLPVPVIFFFARKVLVWGADKKFIGKFFKFCLEKGEKGGKKLQEKAGRGLYWALFIFVGIPLPGTGAWTGTLAASLLDMDFKKSSIAVMAGVILAGIIMGLASAGVFGAAGAILGA
jgi:uncharacterized membrane protein